MAFGNGSTTVPSTSITSSLAIASLLRFGFPEAGQGPADLFGRNPSATGDFLLDLPVDQGRNLYMPQVFPFRVFRCAFHPVRHQEKPIAFKTNKQILLAAVPSLDRTDLLARTKPGKIPLFYHTINSSPSLASGGTLVRISGSSPVTKTVCSKWAE